tara:strand:- start:26712 stop:27119 length:408 start_codon:yes stop_codon:yes gene_type:complete
MEIIKNFSWEMGHRLTFHKDGCQNLHGHSYRCKVTIKGKLDKNGFVMDFKDLKKVVQPLIDTFDHSFMWYRNDKIMGKFFSDNTYNKFKNYPVDFEPTAENISKHIFEWVKNTNLNVSRVKVYETQTSCSQYRGD